VCGYRNEKKRKSQGEKIKIKFKKFKKFKKINK